jgi:hypothetical protein
MDETTATLSVSAVYFPYDPRYLGLGERLYVGSLSQVEGNHFLEIHGRGMEEKGYKIFTSGKGDYRACVNLRHFVSRYREAFQSDVRAVLYTFAYLGGRVDLVMRGKEMMGEEVLIRNHALNMVSLVDASMVGKRFVLDGVAYEVSENFRGFLPESIISRLGPRDASKINWKAKY